MKIILILLCLLNSVLKPDSIYAYPYSDHKETFIDSLIYDFKYTKTIDCEGLYPMHLQGISTNKKTQIYWSFTNELVRTDLTGKLLNRIKVLNHHGDLCYESGKLYVAVNLGKFNELPGQEDSWVFVYDAENLQELARHKVPELVHGAGGISYANGKFYVVGGLPSGFQENYVYKYDKNFKFLKRNIVESGYTRLGIQTIEYFSGQWWFGCYGNPKLIKTDKQFKILNKSDFDASLGIAGFSEAKLFIGNSKANADKLHKGTISVYEK
jgi:outer membrane protein assembly factor BamB